MNPKQIRPDLRHSLDSRVFQLIWFHLGLAFIVMLFNGGLLPNQSIEWRSFGEWIFSPVYLYGGTNKTVINLQHLHTSIFPHINLQYRYGQQQHLNMCLGFRFFNHKLTHFFPHKKPFTSQLNPEIRRQPCFVPLRPPYSRNGQPVTELTVLTAAEIIFSFKVHLQWGDPVHFLLHCYTSLHSSFL